MRTASPFARNVFAALLTVLLGLRLLSPAGFMPSFEKGSVTIVACPDANPGSVPAMPMHHHGGTAKHHELCPYASASAPGVPGFSFGALIALAAVAMALLLGRSYEFVERRCALVRPPSRAPPLPA